MPSIGWQSYRLVSGDGSPGWEPLEAVISNIANEHYRLEVDPSRGGGVSSLVEVASGRELIADGGVGNELAVYDEYPAHPEAGEGPWHLLPKGPVVASSAEPASVQAYRGPLGERLVDRGRIGDVLRYTQIVTLWHGVARVDCRTTVDEFTGADRLLRLRWPCPVPGALPVSEVGDAVIGRGFGLMHESRGICAIAAVDSAKHPWTLDNPAYGWFGLSSAARVRVGDGVRAGRQCRSPKWCRRRNRRRRRLARELMVALVRAGVTATCSSADKPTVRRPDRRLQPARCPDHARRPRPKRLHRSGSRGCGPRLHRGVEATALHQRRGAGVGAARYAVGRGMGARARTCVACAHYRC